MHLLQLFWIAVAGNTEKQRLKILPEVEIWEDAELAWKTKVLCRKTETKYQCIFGTKYQ